MPWFRVDDGFHSHPKTLATPPAALGLWVVAGSWSSDHLTDGFIPDHALPRILPDAAKLAEQLVTSGLWKRRRGGYVFHDFLGRNPSRTAVENDRKKNAERQKRWRETHSNGVTNSVTNGVSNSAPSRPIPVFTADVVNQTNGSKPVAASDETIDAIIKAILEATGRHIPPDWAARIWREQFAGHHPANPVAYVRQAIRNDPNPKQRYLPLY